MTAEVDDVSAERDCIGVSDQYMRVPIIIGQHFTEMPHVMIFKSRDNLIFTHTPPLQCWIHYEI